MFYDIKENIFELFLSLYDRQYEYKYFQTKVFVYFYIDYNESVYYWEFTKIFKRILLIVILIVFIDNPFAQIGLFFIVGIVYQIIYLIVQHYTNR